jgi:two-component system LytT family response regulator
MNLRAIIADDEPLVRTSVRRFLRGHNVEVLEECSDGKATIAALRSHRPDLLFLDMEMPLAKGMEVMAEIGEKNMPATIILTAHENYAVESYDFNVADYILKPFGKKRFERGLSRALHRIATSSSVVKAQHSPPASGQMDTLLGQLPKQPSYVSHIPVPNKYGRIMLLKVREIEWIEAEDNLLLIHCAGKIYELRETLSGLHGRLNPRIFYRIHRSTLVNVQYIREILPWRNGHHVVVLNSGHELRMSRYQRESVERLTNLAGDEPISS